MENPKDTMKKLLELINEFSKLQDTKFTYRNLLCFYTLTINYQKRNQENNPFTTVSKRIKYLGINLSKEGLPWCRSG